MPILTQPVTRAQFWAGAIIAGLIVAFFIFDAVSKLLQVEAVIKASAQLGLPASAAPVIGILLLVCTLIYVIPKTSVLGAILLTGYLGGAIAIHVRAENGAFPILFSFTFGVLVWVSLVLREPRLLKLILMREW
ncbi:MAG TPA: DoxX family protein [Pyrinomonadaceae bacterium]|nr:DoxX family protein [Pyrinomonadaceae bacterium]